MSAISEKVRTAIFAKMNVSSVVGINKATAIYYGIAPVEAVYPFIVFNRVAGNVDRTFQETLIGERDRWFIKCLSDREASSTKSPQELNETILGLAETAIGNSLTITFGTVHRCVRVADIPELLENINDRQVWTNGFQLEVYAE